MLLLATNLSLGKSYLWVADIQTGKEKSIEVDLGSLDESMTISSPRGNYIALGNGAELYVVAATQVSSTLLRRKFNTAITSISFSPDEQSLLVGNEQGMISSRKISEDGEFTFRLHFECKGHFGAVQAITFSHNGKYFASASIDGSICVWEFTDINSGGRNVTTVVSQQQTVIFAPDGQTVAIGSGNTVYKMDAMTGYSIFHREHPLINSQLIFSADGKYLAGSSPELLCWDTGSYYRLNKRRTPRDTEDDAFVMAHALSPNGTHYAVRLEFVGP